MSVYNKVVAGDYKPTIPYPVRPTKPSARLHGLTSAEMREVADATEQYEAEKVAYDAAVSNYRSVQAELDAQFRKDLAADNNLTVGTKGEAKVWEIAEDMGHSSGLAEVALIYDRLAEIVFAVRQDA